MDRARVRGGRAKRYPHPTSYPNRCCFAIKDNKMHPCVLRYFAVCRGVLRMHCSVLQCVAVCCSVLQSCTEHVQTFPNLSLHSILLIMYSVSCCVLFNWNFIQMILEITNICTQIYIHIHQHMYININIYMYIYIYIYICM